MTTTVAHRLLTPLEEHGLDRLVEWVTESVAEVLPHSPEQRGELEAKIRDGLNYDGPMLAKLLGCWLLESNMTGDKNHSESDPPEDGLLGQAIDEYLARALPLVRRSEPYFYSTVIEGNE